MYLKLKAKISLVIMIFTLVMFVGTTVQAAVEPGYAINRYDIRMILQADGSAAVSETLSFQIEKSQSSFRFAIDYEDMGSIRLEGVGVSVQSDDQAEAGFVEVPLAEAGTNQNVPMAYQLQDDGSSLKISLHVLSGEKSSRTVRISYNLSQSVYIHQDIASVSRRFFSIGGPVAISQPSLTIQLPAAVTDLQTWSLPVSAADFDQSQPQPDLLRFQADRLAAGQAMSLHCLLPAKLFAKAPIALQSLTRSNLIEIARQDESAQRRLLVSYQFVNSLVYVLLAFALLLWFLIHWFFDKESGASFRSKYTYEIPSAIPPALMVILMRRARPGRMILATLMDLVRRGVLQLHGCIFSQPEHTLVPQQGLAAYEIFLLEWFFDHLAVNKTLSTADIRRLARDPETAGEFQIYYQTFNSLLCEDFAKANLVDKPKGLRGQNICLLSAALYLIMAIASVLYLQNATGLLLLLPTFILVLYSRIVRWLTVPGRELYARGKALMRSMRQESPADLPDPGFFQRALPLAIGLGVDSDFFKQMLHLTATSTDTAVLLSDYGFPVETGSRPDQIMVLAADVKIMESMLSASLLIAAGAHC